LQQKKNDEQYIKILKENANYKLKNKRFKEAAEVFEKVLKFNKNDLEALPSLVIAYAQFDPSSKKSTCDVL
jgi:Flp pilus assembly protein TadD